MARPKSQLISSFPAIFPSPALVSAIRHELVGWYEANRRDLPWRRTRSPYAIAVSEFMLQQTQVATVRPYFDRWMRRFPSWRALADASEGDVLKAWEGLGYYRRARLLHQLARHVAALPSGELPADLGALEALPGIGPYTARAIASIAFEIPCAVLDGNVIRILARLFAMEDDVSPPAAKKRLQEVADRLHPAAGCGTWNQAVMELGAMICTPRAPRCQQCPLRRACRGKSSPERFPVLARTPVQAIAETAAVIRRDHTWWCELVPPGERLEGLWRFPFLDETSMNPGLVLGRLRYSITKYRVLLTARAASWKSGHPRPTQNGRWLAADEIDSLPFASAHRKLARQWVRAAPESDRLLL